MNAKKKIVSIALAAALAATAIVGSSLAYFTDTEEKTNTFTVGNVDITLTEPGWDATGKEEAEEMYPGEAVAKDPTVTNVGANPAFVRVKVQWPDGVAMDVRTDYVVGKLGDNWKYNAEDGYYYYEKVLNPEEKTDALFDQVVLSTETTNDDATTPYDIVVTAEAIQAQGAAVQWNRVEKMNMGEIANWFLTKEPLPYEAGLAE